MANYCERVLGIILADTKKGRTIVIKGRHSEQEIVIEEGEDAMKVNGILLAITDILRDEIAKRWGKPQNIETGEKPWMKLQGLCGDDADERTEEI